MLIDDTAESTGDDNDDEMASDLDDDLEGLVVPQGFRGEYRTSGRHSAVEIT